MLGDSEDWVRTIVHRSNAAGPSGVADRRHANPGTPPLLSPELREALREAPHLEVLELRQRVAETAKQLAPGCTGEGSLVDAAGSHILTGYPATFLERVVGEDSGSNRTSRSG